MSNAFEEKLTTNQDFRLKSFRVTHEIVYHIFLNKDEIQALINLDLSNDKKLERARDIFVIGCFTGLRISDLKRLSEDHIKVVKGERMIQIEMKKTQKPVTIPLTQEVVAILSKYKSETGYSFPKFISDQKCNDYIKLAASKVPELCQNEIVMRTEGTQRIEKPIPKWQLISNHTARRSFATNMVIAGYQSSMIMRITGHKTEKSFLRYVKSEQFDVLDMYKAQKSHLKLVS